MKLLPDPPGGRWIDAETLSALFDADVQLGRTATKYPSLVPRLAGKLVTRRRVMEAERAVERERRQGRLTLRRAA